MKRVAALDLVRGLAAFSVAIPHYLILAAVAPETSEAVSVLGVEVFFVLSGFVLAPQILACVAGQRPGDLGVFLVRRWMRTIPPYFVALMAMSLVADALPSADFLRYVFYVQNLFAQHNASDYYPIAWSLSIEEWFYVTFPALLFFSARWRGSGGIRFCVVMACLFVMAVTAARLLFGNLGQWGEDVRRVVVFRVDSIAYGFLLYILLRRIDLGRLHRGAMIVGAALLFALAALVAFDDVMAIAGAANAAAKELFPFYAAAFGMSAIFLFYALGGAIEARLPLAAIASFMGRISYSVYLFHLLIAIAVHSVVGGTAILVQLAAYIPCVVAFSAVFFRYFEKPILAARPHYQGADEAGLALEAAANASAR
jgi:peptidoglycan/LPS O-acetylase OafA/YrhL